MPSRANSKGYIALLQDIEADNPVGDIFIIADNLSSHNSLETRTWLEAHPRLHQVFIPTGACWLNLQEGWWRLFRRDALAGQSFANPKEIEQATPSPLLNSICEPSPGSGGALPGRLVIVVVSFLIAFEEWSTRQHLAEHLPTRAWFEGHLRRCIAIEQDPGLRVPVGDEGCLEFADHRTADSRH